MNSDETNEIDEETTSLSNTLGVTSTLDLLELMKLEIDKACQVCAWYSLMKRHRNAKINRLIF